MPKERMHLGAAGPIFDRAQLLRENQTARKNFSGSICARNNWELSSAVNTQF